MNAVPVLHAEHELNASTFTARLVTATVADLYSGVISAIGAPERAEPYIRARLEARARMSKTERADPILRPGGP